MSFAAPASADHTPDFLTIQPYYYNNVGGYSPSWDPTFQPGDSKSKHTHKDQNEWLPIPWGYIGIFHAQTEELLYAGTWGSDGVDPWDEFDLLEGEPYYVLFLFRDPTNRWSVSSGNEGAVYSTRSPIMTSLGGHVSQKVEWNAGVEISPDSEAALFATGMRAWPLLKHSTILAGWPTMLNVIPGFSPTATYFALRQVRVHYGDTRTQDLTHELGHVAEYSIAAGKGAPIVPSMNYNYQGHSGHVWNSAEYKHVAYREALADFVSLASIYPRSSAGGRMSYGSGDWNSAEGYSFETALRDCWGSDARREGNIARLLWVLYDTHNDNSQHFGVPFDGISESFDAVFTETIARFPAGYGDRRINEPIHDSGSTAWHQRDFDARSIEDHIYHFDHLTLGAYTDQINLLGQGNCLWQEEYDSPWAQWEISWAGVSNYFWSAINPF